MTSSYRTKKLIVEGEQDKRVVPYLMEANGIIWEKDKHPVDIAVPTQMRYKIISQGVGAIHELPLQVYLT